MGPDGLRPLSEAFCYQAAYVIGLVCLVGLTWLVFRFVRQRRSKLAVVSCSLVIAIIAAFALHEEYHIQRAETCYRFIKGIRNGTHTPPTAMHTTDGLSASACPNGEIRSTYGSPEEVEEYLRRKHRNWFSGTVVRLRNLVSPTSKCTLLSEGATSDNS